MPVTIYDKTQPCIAGNAFTFLAYLFQRANSQLFQTSPTLTTGDVKISKDGGAYTNITSLPVEVGTSGALTVSLTALETIGATKYISVKFSDVAGAEWCDVVYIIEMDEAKVLNFQTLGAGSVATVFTINDGVNPIDGVDVWVTSDLAGTNVIARGFTNALGVVTLMLDPGAYYVWKTKAGYTFANPSSLMVV